MRGAKEVYDRVREVQAALGTGSVEEALAEAGSLREEAIRLLDAGGSLTSFERTHAAAAFAYASVALILATAESEEVPPAEAVPRIRELAVEAVRRHRPGADTWKALAAAGEMLARSGDPDGAAWAVTKARQLAGEEEELVRLSGSIRSMYPQAFEEAPDPPPDEPPPIPPGRS